MASDTRLKWIKIYNSLDEAKSVLSSKTAIQITIENKQLCAVYHDSIIYVVDEKCPHQGLSLSGSKCKEGSIVCPWHQYHFNLETGRGKGLYLKSYPVKIDEDGVYVGLKKNWLGF